MRAPNAPSTPQIRLHPDAAAVEVQALFRGVVIGTRCLAAGDLAPFLIGSAKGVDAPAAARFLSGEAHPLVSIDGGGFSLEITEQMTGAVIFEDRTTPLQDLLRAHGAATFVPPPAARLQIGCGDVAFLVSPTTPPTELRRPPLARLRDHWHLMVAAGATLLLLALVSFIPPDIQALSGGTIDFTRIRAPLPIVPPEPPKELTGPSGPSGPAGGGDSGPAGGNRRAKASRTSPARQTPRPPPGQAPQELGRHGLIGVLLASKGKEWAHVFASDSALVPGSFDGITADGDPAGMGPGFGPGVAGTGIPGPGSLAGAGPGDTIGRCDAACQDRMQRHARGDGLRWTQPKIRGPQIIPVGVAKVVGSLDKDIVRRVIRRHLNEVKFCYEQQLVRRPELAGRVTVQFTIAPTGAVAGALVSESTLRNVQVEACVAQAVRRWEFPKPNGVVMVSYPFVLVPAGSS